MEKLNNISKILKDCPRGIKLYSAIHGECILDSVYNTGIHIKLHDNAKNIYSFNEFGQCGSFNSECLLFPSKENRDWSTFQIPFKKGDILYIDCNNGEDNYKYNQYIFILKQISENRIDSYCHINEINESKFEICWLSDRTDIKYGPRFATKEEKEKLFKVIKDNGYQWNAETNTLEKINKFDITTLKPFDKVLVRDANCLWGANLYSFYKKPYFMTMNGLYAQCIPYNANTKHLLGTDNDCDDYYKTW